MIDVNAVLALGIVGIGILLFRGVGFWLVKVVGVLLFLLALGSALVTLVH